MKKLITVSLFIFTALTIYAQNLSQAEKLYQDGDFASARPQYQEIIKTATGDTLYQAQLRAAACEYSQGEYLTAAKTMFGYPLPVNPVWKARFLLYRIQLARQVANQYRPVLETREIENNTDLEYWTRPQWHSQIQQDYEALWTLRASLINAPIEQETLILNLKDTDTRRIPTLFDFATQEWVSFLGGTEQALPAGETRTYLDGAAQPFTPHKNRADKLAGVLHTAYSLEGIGRQNARLFWQTDFILLPLERPDFFEIKDKDKAVKTAVVQLQTLFAPAEKTSWWQKAKNYVSAAKTATAATDYGKSYAAYKTAQLLFQHDDRAQALSVCNRAVNEFASSYYTQQCQTLALQITQPELQFSATDKPLNPARPELTFTVRNVSDVYARVYPVTKAQLEQQARRNNRELSDWNQLSQLWDEDITRLLASSATYQTAHVQPAYDKPYFEQQTTLTLPPLEPGFYIVLASYNNNFNPSRAPVTGLVINSTDLALFTTAAIEDNPDRYTWTLHSTSKTYTPSVFHFYSVHLKTGEPEPNTALHILTGWKGTPEKLTTDEQGTAHLARAVTVNGKHANTWEVSTLAEKKGNYALSPHSTYFRLYTSQPVKLFAQTDRAIYRPGQKVQLSVQGFERTPRSWQVWPEQDVRVTVLAANGKQIYQATSTLNAFGTTKLSFTLPEKDLLLGNFSVSATSAAGGRNYSCHHSFKVEEYKRPDYEIELEDPAVPLAYHQQGTVRGHATYYTGTPLQNATVKYTVTRRAYIPPFYWWRSIYSEPETIARGETRTADDGKFDIAFTPAPSRPNEHFTQYVVQAEVYDETGRAIETSRTYKVSTYAHLFKVDFTQGFYDENKSGPLAEITLTDADGNATTGTLTARLSRVKDTPNTKDKHTLDAWYENAATTVAVSTQTLTFKTPGPQTLQIPALPEGVYRLTLQDKHAEEQSIIFLVAAKKSSLHIPGITLPQHSTYYPGETARVLLGDSRLTGPKHAEIYYQKDFLRKSEQLPGGISIYEYPVTTDDRGGLGLAWFGASGYEFYQGSGTFEVPFDNQQLSVRFNAPDVVKPGQTVSWQLTARNAANAPLNGQASVTVYDKSLDYYAKKENPFTLTSLFPQTAGTPGVLGSYPSAYGNTVFSGKDPQRWQPAPELPSLNLVMPRHYYRNTKGLTSRGAMPMMAMAKSATFGGLAGTNETLEETAMLDGAAIPQVTANARRLDRDTTEDDISQPDGNLRTDFAETAYFNTQLPVTGGTARVRFTLPQSITTWNILGFVLTKNAELGTFAANTVTRKDFMVQLHLPRFYREEDNGVLQAAVTNTTSKKITVPVTLSVQQDTQNKAAAFGITQPTKTVTVPANSTAYVQWNIVAPAAPGMYQITAVGRSATDSDGEQKELPLLPSRARLLASVHAALKNGNNTLRVTELDGATDARPELAALTLHPSLALSVLHKMPNLLSNPHNDFISSLNRYVPLAIVHQFYNTYPQLKQAVKKLPVRDGLTAPWNETDPLRLTLLAQTPWLRMAQGNTVRNAEIISLFDDKTVTAKLAQERAKVLTFQKNNGAFTWFTGGPDDVYLTLRALDAFSQAVRFGADVPQANVQKAISYVVPQIEKQLKEDKTGSAGTVSYALYAAYVLSSFPSNWPQVSAAKAYIQKWVNYADEQARFMTPLGQTYAAAVYHRLGDDVKSNRYLEKVLARMKYNELTGAYFAPEAQSWIWYQDTLLTQTATLKTLLEIRPDSDKIDPMVQWLLFNKQVAAWNNPSTAAQAVFVLLDVMQAKGALLHPSSYQINWAGTQQKCNFEPFDWTADLQWVKQGAQLSPAAYTATVSKQSQMTDFASLNVVYTSAQAKASPKGVLNVERSYFVRFTQDGAQKLHPVRDMDEIKTADEIEVHLTLTSDSAFDYVLLTDPKPAGFESADLTSGWSWNPVFVYQEVRDAETNFFINRLPAGKVTLRYVLRPTVPGKFHAQPAQVQSMYAPQFGAHSASEKIQVGK